MRVVVVICSVFAAALEPGVDWGTTVKPIVIASDQHEADNVRVEGADVYWTTARGVFRASRDGGNATRILAGEAHAIAVDAAAVYVARPNGLWKVPRRGGAPIKLAPSRDAGSLALDRDHLYFAEGVEPGLLRRISVLGGTTETLASRPAMICNVALDGDHVYFADVCSPGLPGSFMRLSKRGGDPEVLHRYVGVAGGIAIDATHVYFAQSGTWKGKSLDARVLRMSKANGPGTVEVLAAPVPTPSDLLVGPGFLYARTVVDGVARISLDGAWLETVVPEVHRPFGTLMSLARDDDRVYLASYDDGYHEGAVFAAPIPADKPPAACQGSALDLDSIVQRGICRTLPITLLAAPPANDLTAELAPREATVAAGGTVPFTMTLTNARAAPLSLPAPRLTGLEVEVLDAKGRRVDEQRPGRCRAEAVRASASGRLELAPMGKLTSSVTVAARETKLDCHGRQVSQRPLRVGRYQLRVRTPFGREVRGALTVH